MAIAFVNVGTLYANASTTATAAALPGSIVAGNLLLALGMVRTTSTVGVSSGWTIGDTKTVVDLSSNTWKFIWAWRVATGSDTAAAFSWTGATAADSIIAQFSGTLATPFTGVTSNNTGTATPHTAPSITATAGGSAMYIDLCRVGTALTTPAGWTSSFTNIAGSVAFSVGLKPFSGTGDTSGAISAAGGTDAYSLWQLELNGPASLTMTMNGGVLVGGAATIFPPGTITTNGGVLVGGAADMQFKSAFVLTTTGGALVGGAATFEFPTSAILETLPPYQSSGLLVNGTVITLDEPLPIYTSTGNILGGSVSTLAEELPVFTMVGDFGWFAANTLPAPDLDSAVLVGSVSSGDITLPVYNLSAALVSSNILTGDSTLPAFVLDASTVTGGLGSAALLLPAHQMAAAGFTGAVLTGANTLPLYVLVAQGFGTYTFSGANTLPAYQLDAAMSQAVAAAFRAWVMNVRKRPLTEYTNFPFNSFATCEGRTFAAGPSGIYELTEALDDAGTAIASVVRTGKHNFGVTYAKRVPRIYAATAATGDLEFRTITGADGRRGYLLPWNQTSEVQQRRIPINRGPKSTYWQFEFINRAGADFYLDSLIIRPELTQRRVSPG